MRARKKSQYFEIDALIAVGLLLGGLIYIKGLAAPDNTYKDIRELSRKSMALLQETEIRDLPDSVIDELEEEDPIKDKRLPIATLIGRRFFDGKIDDASLIVESTLGTFIPNNRNFAVWIRDSNDVTLIYSRGQCSIYSSLVITRTLITGLVDIPEAAYVDLDDDLGEIEGGILGSDNDGGGDGITGNFIAFSRWITGNAAFDDDEDFDTIYDSGALLPFPDIGTGGPALLEVGIC